ncbi:MAG: hypothetical protein WBQ61_00645 [Candidatus Acidiferrum sp.]
MTKKSILLIASSVAALFLAGFFIHRCYWRTGDSPSDRERLLSMMPGDSTIVAYVDLAQFRSSPFLSTLFRFVPKAAPDTEYAEFLKMTGFNYETDLDRVALSINRQSQPFTAFAVADGRFDRKKIEAFVSRYGSLKTAEGNTLFAVPLNGSSRKAYLTFLNSGRVAWANDPSYFFQQKHRGSSADWRDHFLRVAGTPIFAVLRQDSDGDIQLTAQAPGGFQSPQLAALLNQLQWVSISGKPEGDFLRVVVDGECAAETTQRQLKDVLGGLLVLAQAGLNDPKTRRRLDPALRSAYLELLQSADIQSTDLGKAKSIRVVFDLTQKLLEAAPDTSYVTHPAQSTH